ncbi:hypothetical protein ACH4MJ_16645 [Streptomyces anulatus]
MYSSSREATGAGAGEAGSHRAVGWLRRHRVLLPGVSVLAKQVAAVWTVAEKRLYATVANATHRADGWLRHDLLDAAAQAAALRPP